MNSFIYYDLQLWNYHFYSYSVLLSLGCTCLYFNRLVAGFI